MAAGDGISTIEEKPEVKVEDQEMAVKDEVDQSSHAGDQSMTTATEDMAVHDAVVPDSGDVGHEKFCESIMDALGRLLTKYGSCGSFLRSRFGTTESATEFCDFLHDLCEAHEPSHSLQLPLKSVSLDSLNTGGCKPIALPLGAFSFAPSASLKPDADHALVLSLARQILKDGFISAAEPLICTCHAELYQEAQTLKVSPMWKKTGDLLPFSIGFLKGKARMHTLLTIMAICFDNEVHPQDASCLVI